MGFFKKVFKSVKKGFKSIGKGIKSAFKKFGKFMGKIGIVGQLALMFTPVGAMMSNMFAGIGQAAGGVFSKVTGALAQGGKIAQGAGKLLEAGANFAKAGHSAFRTVTDGVSSFIGEFSKTALKKIPGMQTVMPSLSSASDTFFSGPNSAWSTVQNEVTQNATAVLENFNKAIGKAPTVTTAAQANAVQAAQKTVDTAATGATYDAKGFALEDDYAERFSFKNIDPIVEASQKATTMVEPESLLSQVTDYGKELAGKTVEAVKSIPGKILEVPDKFVQDIDKKVTSGLETKAMQAIGLEDKPEYITQQYSSYVPEFSTAPAGTYGSSEINDRAMQLQLSGTDFYQQQPFGAGAHFYTQQMARSIGGTV